MTFGRYLVALAAPALLLLAVSPVGAEEPEGSVSLGLSFGVVTGQMNDVNHLIGLGNVGIGAGSLSGREGLDEISGGFQFAAELRARINPWLVIGAGAENDVLKQRVSYNFIYEAEVHAVPVRVTAYWYSPWGAKLHENLDFFAGAGLTSLQNVEVTYHAERDIPGSEAADRTEEMIFTGSGAGAHALAGFEFLLTPRVTFLGEVGYRFAKATDLKPERKIQDAQSQDLDRYTLGFLESFGNPQSLEADFSGVEGKVTFRFYLL